MWNKGENDRQLMQKVCMQETPVLCLESLRWPLTAGVESTRGALVEEGAAKVCPARLGRALGGSDGLYAGERQ